MILYFSGTGNSKFVADYLADSLQDSGVCLNDLIKNKEQLKIESSKPLILVAPIYAWRYPEVVTKLLEQGAFQKKQDIYFVATMGSETGNCDHYCKKIAKNKGLNYKGFCGVPMSSNYVVSSTMPGPEQVQKSLEQAQFALKDVAETIKNGAQLCKKDKTPMSGIKSGIVNAMFRRFVAKGEERCVSDQCIKCGTCEKFCPVNNITIEGDKPVFGNHCISCYSCIHRCPVQAINVKGKTEEHGRYLCPDYIEWKQN